MLERPEYAWPGTDADLRALVAEHPWVTLVSSTPHGLVVSHLPVVPDPGLPDVAVLGHLPVTDATDHHLGEVPTVMVVQGVHGYVSASWYVGGPYVPTWNYVVAHLHGRPERLGAEATFEVLERTVDHFEQHRPEPFRLDQVGGYAARLAPPVVGFRLLPSRVEAKAKLSQDKPATDLAAVLAGLEDPADVHAAPELATVMRRGGIPRGR